MKQQIPFETLFSKLQNALVSGYVYPFFLDQGKLTSPLIQQTFNISEVSKEVFTCIVVRANLYIINAADYKGTLIISWNEFLFDD